MPQMLSRWRGVSVFFLCLLTQIVIEPVGGAQDVLPPPHPTESQTASSKNQRDCSPCDPSLNLAQPPVTLRATEVLISEYVGDNSNRLELGHGDDDNFWVFRNILHLNANNRYLEGGARVDALGFAHPPGYVSPEELSLYPGGRGYTTLIYQNDVRIERAHLSARLGELQLTVGDFYVNFGRGMVLSLIKQHDIGVDNALRGGRLHYTVPGRLEFVLVGGVINGSNVDPVTHQLWRDDPLDRIVGSRVEYTANEALDLSIHGVFMRPRFTEESAVDETRNRIDQGTGIGLLSGGATVEWRADNTTMYLEGNAQQHDNYRPPGDHQDVHNETGYAAYGELSYNVSALMIQLQGFFYRRWLMEGPYRGSSGSLSFIGAPVPYHHLVTLEPKWMTINALGNASGGRLTGSLFISRTDTQLTLQTAGIVYERGLVPQGSWTDGHPRCAIVHPIVEVRQNIGSAPITVVLNGGYRYERALEPAPAGKRQGRLWHVKGDITLPLNGPHSIELVGEVRRHELHVNELNEHWITASSLQYAIAGRFDVAVLHEFSDQTMATAMKIGSWRLPFKENHYFTGAISFHAPRPLEGLSLKLSCGAQRGGIKCLGGVCREYPEAVGGRLEATYRF